MFKASTNEAEYEALLAGLRLAVGLMVKRLQAFSDSQLVVNPFNGDYDTKQPRMEAYLEIAKGLTQQFDEFLLTQISRGGNTSADALAALASTSDLDLPRCSSPEMKPMGATPSGWLQSIAIIDDSELPLDKWESRKLKQTAARYITLDGDEWRMSGSLLAELEEHHLPPRRALRNRNQQRRLSSRHENLSSIDFILKPSDSHLRRQACALTHLRSDAPAL